MLVTKISELSGKEHTIDLPVTTEQLLEYSLPHKQRRHVQQIFPSLSADQREFIMSGITKEEWDAAFPEEEE